MLADMAKNVGGEHVQVVALMGPGVDPHLYKPTAGDIARITEADLILFGGLHLEGRMTEVFDQLSDKSLDSSRALRRGRILLADDAPDPHFWHDPVLWAEIPVMLAASLSKLDPLNQETYEQNAKNYRAALLRLADESREHLSKVPEQSRVLVTAHDAFQYFGEQFGFEVLGIQGTNTVSEAGANSIRSLADLIVNRKIKAIFVESSVPPATIQALFEAVRSRGWQIQIGGELFSDAMGEEGTHEGTYVGMIQHNVRTIAEALK